jgi:hypothetical protein
LADEEKAFLRVCSFLGVTPRRLEFKTVRQAHGPPYDVIANFGELAQLFANTELGPAFQRENFSDTIIANRAKRRQGQ